MKYLIYVNAMLTLLLMSADTALACQFSRAQGRRCVLRPRATERASRNQRLETTISKRPETRLSNAREAARHFVAKRVVANFYDASLDVNVKVVVDDPSVVQHVWDFVQSHLDRPRSTAPAPSAGGPSFNFVDEGGRHHIVSYDSDGDFEFDKAVKGTLSVTQIDRLNSIERNLKPLAGEKSMLPESH
jgi:hypothetical protein